MSKMRQVIRLVKLVVVAKVLTACGPKQQEPGREVYAYRAKPTVERLPVMGDVYFTMDTADSVNPDTLQLPCDTVYFYDTITMPCDTVVIHDTIVLPDTTCTDCMTIINNGVIINNVGNVTNSGNSNVSNTQNNSQQNNNSQTVNNTSTNNNSNTNNNSSNNGNTTVNGNNNNVVTEPTTPTKPTKPTKPQDDKPQDDKPQDPCPCQDSTVICHTNVHVHMSGRATITTKKTTNPNGDVTVERQTYQFGGNPNDRGR